MSAVRRVLTAVAVFLLSLSALLLPAAAQNSAFGPAVWLTDHKHLKRIDLVTNQVDLIVSLDHEAEALAVDPADSAVWVLAQKELSKFDSNGQAIFQVDACLTGAADCKMCKALGFVDSCPEDDYCI